MPESSASPSAALAAAQDGSPLPSTASTLRAPPGMAFAVQHNPDDNSHTLRLVPEGEAAHPWPQATTDTSGPSSGSSKEAEEKEKNPIMIIVRDFNISQIIRWFFGFFVLGVSAATVAGHPSTKIAAYALFNVVLACIHSVTYVSIWLKPTSPTSAVPHAAWTCYLVADFVLSLVATSFVWAMAFSSEGTLAIFFAAFVSTIHVVAFARTLGATVKLLTDQFSAEDLEDAFRRSGLSGSKPRDVQKAEYKELHSLDHGDDDDDDDKDKSCTGDNDDSPPACDDGVPDDNAPADETSKKDESTSEKKNPVTDKLGLVCAIHQGQGVLSVVILAISVAVIGRHPNKHMVVFAVFNIALACFHILVSKLITPRTSSPSSAKTHPWYFRYAAVCGVPSFVANILMWCIYYSKQDVATFFASWAGTAVTILWVHDMRVCISVGNEEFSAEDLEDGYWNPHTHFDFSGSVSGQDAPPVAVFYNTAKNILAAYFKLWTVQSILSLATLVISSVELTSDPKGKVLGYAVYNLILSFTRTIILIVLSSDDLSTKSAKPIKKYMYFTIGHCVLTVMAAAFMWGIYSAETKTLIWVGGWVGICASSIAVADVCISIRDFTKGDQKEDVEVAKGKRESTLVSEEAVGLRDDNEHEHGSSDAGENTLLRYGQVI